MSDKQFALIGTVCAAVGTLVKAASHELVWTVIGAIVTGGNLYFYLKNSGE